jgi:hypothetical protein
MVVRGSMVCVVNERTLLAAGEERQRDFDLGVSIGFAILGRY